MQMPLHKMLTIRARVSADSRIRLMQQIGLKYRAQMVKWVTLSGFLPLPRSPAYPELTVGHL
jgi:hypothetical protein